MSLDTQTKKMNIIINFPIDCKDKKIIIGRLDCYLQSNVVEYYYILHDKDVNDAIGTLKTPHLHLVILLDKKTRLLTVVNRLGKELFKDDKHNNLITIDTIKSYDFAIAYLVHKNDKFKYQYKITDVKTNNFEYLNAVIKSDVKNELTIDYLIQLCVYHDNVLDVLKELGLWNSKTYLNVITFVFSKVKGLPF